MARDPYATFQVITGDEFRRVGEALRAVDASFPTRLRRELRQAARPLAARAKAKVRAMPALGNRHTGLRRRVAAGVGLRVSLSRNPGISITTSMRDPSEAAIPRGMDSSRGWRHPVFGNTDVWVRQTTGGSWFLETMREGAPGIRGDVERVIEDAAQTIADAGGRL